jgi:hypothetical protein
MMISAIIASYTASRHDVLGRLPPQHQGWAMLATGQAPAQVAAFGKGLPAPARGARSMLSGAGGIAGRRSQRELTRGIEVVALLGRNDDPYRRPRAARAQPVSAPQKCAAWYPLPLFASSNGFELIRILPAFRNLSEGWLILRLQGNRQEALFRNDIHNNVGASN